MIELPLVFLGGILGSSHCLGMCGPFALTIGTGAGSWRATVGRQLVYTFGRVFTYGVFGAAAGFVGWKLQRSVDMLQNSAAILAIAAGLFLLYEGLASAGVLRRKATHANASLCLGGSFLASFLRSPHWSHVFLAGLFTGMLPCGLVYGFLALAASSGDLFSGAALMAIFGLGTAPLMILAGSGGSLIRLSSRRRLYRIAAWCVVLTGLVAITRGLGFLSVLPFGGGSGCH